MRLSAAIMGHPVRRRYVNQLRAQLDRDVPVIYDENPIPSADPKQRWRVARRAWEAHDPDADWHLVLQDDAAITHDLLAGLEKALDQMPRDTRGNPAGLVSAYSGTGRPDQQAVARALARAEEHDHTWYPLRSLYWGVAVIAPVWTIPKMLDWCSRETYWSSQSVSNLDYRIGRYYRDMRHWRTWYLIPSLVEHRDLKSLVGHDYGPPRVAHNFPGTRASALSFDWAKTPTGGLTARW